MIWSEFIIFYGAAEQAGGSTLAPTLRSSQGALSPLLIPRAKSGLVRAIYLFSFSTHLRRDFPCLPVQSLEGAASTNAPPVEISDWLIFSSSSAKGTAELGITLPTPLTRSLGRTTQAAQAQTLPHIDPQQNKNTRSESSLNCVDFTEIL